MKKMMEINGSESQQDYYLTSPRNDIPIINPTIHFKPPFDLGEMIEIFRRFYDDFEGPSMFEDEFCETIKYFAASCFSDCLFVARDEHQKFFMVGALIKAYNMLNPGQKILFVTNTDKETNIQEGQLHQTGLSVQILRTLSSIYDVCDRAKILVCTVSFLNDNLEAFSNMIPIESVSLLIMNEILLNRKKYLFLIRAMTETQRPRIFATISKYLGKSKYESEKWGRSANLQYLHHSQQGDIDELILDAISQQSIEENIILQEPLPEYESENCHLEFFKFNSFDKLKLVLHEISAPPSVQIRYHWQEDKVKAKLNFFKTDEMSFSKSLLNVNSISSNYGFTTWLNVFQERNDSARYQALVVEMNVLTTFNFTDSLNIEEPLFEGKLKLTMNRHKITISNNNKSFIVKKNQFDDCFLIEESDYGISIFMCLKSPPSYLENKNYSAFHFENRAFNLCFRKNQVFDEEMNEIRIYLRQWSRNIHNIVNVPKNYVSQSVSLPIKDPEKFCLIRQWQSNFRSILPPDLPEDIVHKLISIQSNRELELTLINNTPERFKELKIKEFSIKNESEYDINSYYNANSKYIKVPSVTVTPSRIIYNSMKLIRKNRVHRYYDDPNHFISVNFQSENGSWNPWHNENVRNFFRDILKNGIPLAGRTYKFLGCSNSQLRETDGRCWFSDLDNETVYAKIGNFSNLKDPNPGRKLTRLAHAFGSSDETVKVDHEKYLKDVADDIMGGSAGNITFSDGIGRGSIKLFEKIAAMLQVSPSPTAFQIRVGGIKGVISKYHQQEELIIRKSMKKFESDHDIIEVLNFNRSSPVYLNRVMVLILSQLGVPDEVFMTMQNDYIKTCIDALNTTEKDALKFINCPLFIEGWTRLGDNIVKEPFFKKILRKQIQMRISSVANKTKIKIDNGRMLMGVLDETGELEYGQVFVQIVENTDGSEHILDCEILLSRNPCVLPSDIRLLRATSDVSPRMKELYKNVVVFPSRGENSHANECAGGDLDGDIYSVIWDEKLIPKNLKSPGREVVAVKMVQKIDKDESNKHIILDDMIDYFCIFHHRNVLGKLANAHLALAELFGIENERTMDLAKVLVAETDAPIKGFTVDEDSYKELLPDKYPHYMMKFDRESFHSKKVVGKMYDEAWSMVQTIKKSTSDKILPHHYRVNSAKTSKSAVEYWYALYCDEICELMIKFKVNNEVDLFLGLPSSDKHSRDNFKSRKENKELIMHVLEQFWMKWKTRFENFKHNVDDDEDELLNWYNGPKFAFCPAESFSLFALPYIDDSELCNNRVTLADLTGASIKVWILKKIQNFVSVWWQDEHIRSKIQNDMEDTCSFIITDISILGFGNYSPDLHLWTDGDLQAIESTLPNQKIIPKNEEERKLKEIRLTHSSRSILITNDTEKLKIVSSIAKFFDANKDLWPPLRVLLRWARIANIVDWHHGSRPKELMTTYNFILLFIEHVSGQSLNITESTEEKFTQERLLKWMTPEFDPFLHFGGVLLNFLRMLCDSNQQSFILKKRDPDLNLQFLEKNFVELQKKAKHALFIVSLYDGKICEIMPESKVQPVVRNKFRYRPTRFNHRKNSSKKSRPQVITDNFHVKIKFENGTVLKLIVVMERGEYFVEVVCTHKKNLKNEELSIKSKMLINAMSHRNRENYYAIEYEKFEKFFLAQMIPNNKNDSEDSAEKEESKSTEKDQDEVAVQTKTKISKAKRKILKRKNLIKLPYSSTLKEVNVDSLQSKQKQKSRFKIQMNANNINIFTNENGFIRYSRELALPIGVEIFITWNNYNLIIMTDHHGKFLCMQIDDQESKTEKTAPAVEDFDQLRSQLFDQIICTPEFVRQINDQNLTQQSLNRNCANPVQLSEFNVTLRKFSVSKRASLYSNYCRDIMIHSTEFSGTFSDNTNGFEWHPVKTDLTVEINDEGHCILRLCKKTFEMALALFRLEKKSF